MRMRYESAPSSIRARELSADHSRKATSPSVICVRWLQLARGAVALNGHAMKEDDGAALADEDVVRVEADAESEVLLFDLV